ncbi:MAG: DNA polymerase III subunit delta, partial [Myxococcota bacterium]|nr:DNA polymerase III subunit delta [Myxococcota bacterium]
MARADQDKARQFFKDIKSGPVAGVYLFHGDERYLVERAIDAVQKRVLGADEDDDAFRMQKLRAGDVGAKTLIESARTVPMLGGQQMLVVRDCERFSDEEIAQLAEYAAKASKRSCLVLCANKVDGRKAGWKKLRSAACEVAFAPLYRNQMADWIVRQAKLKKLAISAEAADYLAEAVGTDMALADVALQKLALAESAEISLETAKMLVADTRERSVFELTDAISVRDTGTALKALRNMLVHGAECLAIAFMLARHVRLLLKVKSGLD